MPSTIVPVLDLPFFELCNQAPVASGATAAFSTAEDGTDRFIYYLSGSTFYRYDTEQDTWQQLANPGVAPVTLLSMRHTKRRGYHGRVISATASSIRIVCPVSSLWRRLGNVIEDAVAEMTRP